MNPLGHVLGTDAGDAAEATAGKARMMVLRVLDLCRVATLEDLPAHVRPTLVALGKCADALGVCWPSYRVLAEYTGRTRRTVMRHVAQLAAFVRKQHRYRVDARSPEQPRNRTNKFFIDVPDTRPRARRFASASSARPTSNAATPAPASTPAPPPERTPRPAATCMECLAAQGAERAAVHRAPACAGRIEAPVTAMCEESTRVLRTLRAVPLLAHFANDEDAARLWSIAKEAACTVGDVERAIVELVKKTPTRVRFSRVGAWTRLVSFVEGAGKPKDAPSTTARSRAAEELRRDAEDRRRDEEAARGAIPIPAAIVAQLRHHGLLPMRPP